ncbi:MAG: response regulator [Deltaproteobacteria bacterium]|nr:response regulator [Deltaproteobacteria bacterium]
MIPGTISILLVEDDEDDFVVTRDLLAEAQGRTFNLVWARTYEDAVREIRARHYDVYLVDYRLGGRTGLDLLAGELEQGRLGPVIILTGQGTHDVDVEAMKLGAAGYLVKGELRAGELERTIRYAIERHEALPGDGRGIENQPHVKRARVVAFLGAKGGVGTTSVVANVAIVLANRGLRITAIEVRGDYGGLTRLLNIAPLGDLGQLLAGDSGVVDPDTLEEHIALHPTGLRVLAAPQSVEHFRTLSAGQATAIIEAAAVGTDLVLLDLPASAVESNREALRAADLVALVLDREPSSLTAARVTLDLLRSWRIEAPVGTVIVSRVTLPEAVPIAEIHALLSLRKYGIVPAAPDLFYRAAASYTPIVVSRPEHIVSKALDELALCMLLLR